MNKIEIKNEVFARMKKYTPYENVDQGYARWGEYDDLAQKLVRVAEDAVDANGLSEGSTWHSACVAGIQKHIVADGLSIRGGASTPDNEITLDLPPSVNNFAETFNEIFDKIAGDWSVLNGFALEVIWTAGSVTSTIDELQIAEIYQIPIMNVRSQERNSRGLVEGYFVSKYFGSRRNKIRNTDDERVEFIPRFNPGLVPEEGDRPAQMKQLLVVTTPSRTGSYYNRPSYAGGLIDIFTDSLLRKARVSTLNQSIIASSVYQIAGLDDEATEIAFMKSFDEQIVGAQNAGTPIILKKPKDDQHIIGQPQSIGDTTDTSADFDNDIRARIFSSHGVTSARILGIKEDNQGFSTEQIMEEFLVFTTLTIRPIQTRILAGINKLADYIIGSGNTFIINPIQLAEVVETGVQEDVEEINEDNNLTIEQDA